MLCCTLRLTATSLYVTPKAKSHSCAGLYKAALLHSSVALVQTSTSALFIAMPSTHQTTSDKLATQQQTQPKASEQDSITSLARLALQASHVGLPRAHVPQTNDQEKPIAKEGQGPSGEK